ncbi:GlxA family transcriptional regulator [Rhizobium sp. LCM 4573]|uniref:GlxA family transcriptional regulator n=1 Tax=Rhizobium sp. LCM 4573 TaxID=1848291 RepID=UPI0008DA38BE|nr:GlxA family transcriptional regulator [Rhizobium sp. LCM 4573]OHV78700.1 AraC family transcriptional regulator [Rhizobium sp. LCM 4573]
MQTSKPRMIIVLAVPGVQLLDVSGPLDVFAEANRAAGKHVYEMRVAALEPGPIRSSSGIRLMPDLIADGSDQSQIDTLLVAGSPHAPGLKLPERAIAWLEEKASQSKRYGSVCSGAFFLAAAGLLKGRTVTTHWAVAQELASRFPDVRVEGDAIHIKDGPVRTSAGVTAGLDLALSLVEEDLGPEVARDVASQLVMFFKRPGGQMQFSRKAEAAPTGRAALQELQRWVASNPELDHTVRSMAERLGLSPRHFARMFRKEVGTTPATWVEDARVSAARRYLENGEMAPKKVAALCGFGDVDTFRRAFVRTVGVTPADYRRRFAGLAN